MQEEITNQQTIYSHRNKTPNAKISIGNILILTTINNLHYMNHLLLLKLLGCKKSNKLKITTSNNNVIVFFFTLF